jgi:hypothetical protein
MAALFIFLNSEGKQLTNPTEQIERVAQDADTILAPPEQRTKSNAADNQTALSSDAFTAAYCEGVIASRIEAYQGYVSHDCPAKVDSQMCKNLANKEIERLRQNMRWILVYLEPYGHDMTTAAALQNFVRAGMDDDLSGMEGAIKLLGSDCVTKAKDPVAAIKSCDPRIAEILNKTKKCLEFNKGNTQ